MYCFQQTLLKHRRIDNDESVMEEMLLILQDSLVRSPPWWEVLEEILQELLYYDLYQALSRFLSHTHRFHACLSLSACLSVCLSAYSSSNIIRLSPPLIVCICLPTSVCLYPPVHLPLSLSVCLPTSPAVYVHLSVCPSHCLPTSPAVYVSPSVSPSHYLCLSAYLPGCFSACLSLLSLSVCLPTSRAVDVCPFVFHLLLSVCLSASFSSYVRLSPALTVCLPPVVYVRLSPALTVFLSVCLPTSPVVYVRLSVCQSHC